MRNWQIAELGQPPELGQAPEPVPGPGEALVRVAACGLNFADLLMIEGRYQERRPPPFTLGLEGAGTVAALGPGTTAPAIGTRVLAFVPGAMAEAICLPATLLAPIPDSMSFAQAAGFPVAYGTSHLALDHRARLQPGETLLVTGASGGVGLTAVELGARMGARVIAMARGAEKLAIARAVGAHEVIDSDTPDLKSALRALGGCDVVYDTVGGDLFGITDNEPDAFMAQTNDVARHVIGRLEVINQHRTLRSGGLARPHRDCNAIHFSHQIENALIVT